MKRQRYNEKALRRREHLIYTFTAIFATLCVLAGVWMILIIKDSKDAVPEGKWYVEDAGVEIAAPGAPSETEPVPAESLSVFEPITETDAPADESAADPIISEETQSPGFVFDPSDPFGDKASQFPTEESTSEPTREPTEEPTREPTPTPIPQEELLDVTLEPTPTPTPDPFPDDDYVGNTIERLFDDPPMALAAAMDEDISENSEDIDVENQDSEAEPDDSVTPDNGETLDSGENLDSLDELLETPTTAPAYEPEPAAESGKVLITFAGDCTLGGDYNGDGHERFDSAFEKKGAEFFFSNVRDFLSEDDLTFVNLEGPLTKKGSMRPHRQFNFKGDPAYATILSSGSVEVAGLANNHAMDFGKKGLRNTALAVDAEGIGVCGYKAAYTTRINGVNVCCLSVTEWDFTTEQLTELVQANRQDNDLVLVMIHWGEEKRYKATKSQIEYAHALIDAGADIVVGSHPHVVGGLELYNGKYIVYSLGNFCFGGAESPYDDDCMMFRVEFTLTPNGAENTGIAIIPCSDTSSDRINNFQPQILTGKDAKRVIKKIAKYSRKVKLADITWHSSMDPYMSIFE